MSKVTDELLREIAKSLSSIDLKLEFLILDRQPSRFTESNTEGKIKLMEELTRLYMDWGAAQAIQDRSSVDIKSIRTSGDTFG